MAYAFEWGKLFKYSLKDKLAGNGQIDRIFIFMKKKNVPKGLSVPAPGLYTCTWP